MTPTPQPADPRRWRPLIFSLLAWLLPFFLLNIAIAAVVMRTEKYFNYYEKLMVALGDWRSVLAITVLQLLALDWLRRRSGWRWVDVGFGAFSRRSSELLWQIPVYLGVLLALNQLLFSPEEIRMLAPGRLWLLPRSLPADLIDIPPLLILFCGFVQNFCRARWGSRAAVVLPITTLWLLLLAFYFSSPALPLRILAQLLLPVWVGGLGLALLQERHRTLCVPMLARALNTLLVRLLY